MADKKYKILVVDDEPDILEFIGYNLSKENYEVISAHDGISAIKAAKEHKPDLILLDIMMPKLDGIETCKHLRNIPEFKDTLIVFLTALGDEQSEIKGLNIGADDYIVKPIKPKLLVSRVNALIRRLGQGKSTGVVTVGDIVIDRESYLVKQNGKEISLPRKEFELMNLLASKPGKVFHREEILSKVWGQDIIVGDRTIDVHIRKLRQKFGDNHIGTVKGVGYKFEL
jgi:two-component system, OmpR family, alkaline phosphatase synthesis response regulator PhoP